MFLRSVLAASIAMAALGQAQDVAKRAAADALASTGYAQLEAGNHLAAEDAFRRLREVAPNDPRGIVGLAKAYFTENREEEAIELMRTESARKPEREELLAALGDLFTHAGRYDDALAVYRDLVTRRPNSAEALLNLGDTYRVLGDLTNALAMFKRASEVDPSNAKTVLQLAMLLEGMGLRAEAAPVYERVLQIDPDSTLALNNLAYMMAEDGGDVSRAMEMAQRAHLKAPGSPDITDTLGFIYIKRNFGRDAIALYRPLVEEQPRYAIYHYHFALALLQTGDQAGALRELNLALQVGAPQDEERKIRELLGTLK